MFEDLFVKNYGLRECDLSAYFDEVQIQQTPDYAYGEEIAVRQGSDRFSLANSYRVFVDRLGSGMPPWVRADDDRLAAAPGATGTPISATPEERSGASYGSSWAVGARPPLPLSARPPAAGHATRVTGAGAIATGFKRERPSVFLSCAADDRDRVRPIVSALVSQGFHVWDLMSIPAGAQFDRAVADALDGSDVVIVCWTKASIVSEFVLAEAGEGLRRGVLIPVLLDDVHPPLGFRGIQSADLRRDVEGGVKGLVDAVSRIARGSPGAISALPAERSSRNLRPWFAGAAGIVLTVFAVSWYMARVRFGESEYWRAKAETRMEEEIRRQAVEGVRVPNFKGEQTDNVRKAAAYLGLRIVFRDESGKESPSLEGVVVDQSPPANQQVARGSSLKLTVATATATVPTVVGLTLDEAVLAPDKARLRIATTGERPVPDVSPGTIVAQLPVAGEKAAVGSGISVTIATPP
jgi:hypothetical protein